MLFGLVAPLSLQVFSLGHHCVQRSPPPLPLELCGGFGQQMLHSALSRRHKVGVKERINIVTLVQMLKFYFSTLDDFFK